MPTFFATARDSDGRAVQRQIEASNRAQALAQLRGLGLTSVRLREQLPAGDDDAQARASLLRRPTISGLTRSARQSDPSDETGDTQKIEIADLLSALDDEALADECTPAPSAGPVRQSPARSPKVTVAAASPPPVSPSPPAPSPLPAPAPPRNAASTAPLLSPPASPRSASPTPTSTAKPVAPSPPSPPAPRDGSARPPNADTSSALAKPSVPRPRLTPVDRLTFFSALANMLTAGIPMARAMGSLSEQFADVRARAVLEHICLQLRRGQSLSTAMGQMPDVFSRLQIGVVAGAEGSGRLAPAMQRLHGYEERTLALTRRIQATLTYPLTVFACAIGLVLFIGRSLVTGMSPMLAQAKVELNLATRAVMAFANALDHPSMMLAFVATCIALTYAFARYLRTPAGQVRRDRFLMRTPLVATLLRRVETTRICEAMAVLYGSGVPILQSLELTAQCCDNVVAREALETAQRELARGVGLADGVGASGFFDRTVVQMVRMGEETGRIELALTKVAQYNDIEVQTALDQFAVTIEPLMFTVLGVVVGIIALVAFAPLYQLMEAMT